MRLSEVQDAVAGRLRRERPACVNPEGNSHGLLLLERALARRPLGARLAGLIPAFAQSGAVLAFGLWPQRQDGCVQLKLFRKKTFELAGADALSRS